MGLISVSQVADGDTADASDINGPVNTIVDEFNGNIESVNIKDGTLVAGDFATAVNPETRGSELVFDHVASGCVWSGDAYGSTRVASMTSGVVYISGKRVTVSSVTSRTFTASKDTYIDVDNTGTITYTEVTNNAASPALTAGNIRLGIIITGAGNIANVGSVNQGQPNKVLPIASNAAYSVQDSLGNLICPRDPNRRILGFRQIVTSYSTSTNGEQAIAPFSCPIKVPTGRSVRVKLFNRGVQMNTGAPNAGTIRLWEGTVGSGTQIADCAFYLSANTSDFPGCCPEAIYTPSSTSVTINPSIVQASANTKQITAGSTDPAYISVELV